MITQNVLIPRVVRNIPIIFLKVIVPTKKYNKKGKENIFYHKSDS